jgi:hypothetical protein
MFRITRPAALAAALVFAAPCLTAPALAQTAPAPVAPATSTAPLTPQQLVASARNFAPGFTARTAGSKLVIVPFDMELFSLGAGGVAEPRADWTEAAQKHFREAVKVHKEVLADNAVELRESDVDELAQVNALHSAVATAVRIHHVGMQQLPTKGDRLDWSLGDAVQPLREKTGGDYALFIWVRDSYATAERKAAMVAMTIVGAALGVGIVMAGGQQNGYASLVDLKTGRIVWFNTLARSSGDLREAQPAMESVGELLKGFPAVQ